MPRLTQKFDPGVGPVIFVTVSDPVSHRQPDESPRSEKLTMLIDTGASDTSIRGDIAERLGLPVIGLYDVHGIGNTSETLRHLADIDLWLDSPHEIRDWKLLQFASSYDRIQGILGRDILATAQFSLDGPNRQFTLSFKAE